MTKLKRLLYLKFARSMNRNNAEIHVPAIISNGTRIKGDIICDGILHIDGHVEGDISCEELIVGVKGSVAGSIVAKSFQLYGTLTGKAAAEKIFLAKSAKLVGDVSHMSIAIEPGAYIEGRCLRMGEAIPAEQACPDLLITDNSKHKRK